MIKINTKRLLIRNFYLDDWCDLQDLAVNYQASELAKYEDPWPTAADEVQGMASYFASGDDYLAVFLRDAGKLIGMIAIEPRSGEDELVHNLGYVFHPGYYGHGYATEGCRAVMAYLFDQLGIAAILTGTRLENIRSVELLARLGIPHIGNGEFRLSKAEWMAQKNAAA